MMDIEYRQRIEAEIQSLRSQQGGLTEASQPVAPDVSLGRLTRMDAIQSKSISEAALKENQARVIALQHALQRLEKGEYTICSSCGNEIGQARLQYMPETTLCVTCA